MATSISVYDVLGLEVTTVSHSTMKGGKLVLKLTTGENMTNLSWIWIDTDYAELFDHWRDIERLVAGGPGSLTAKLQEEG